MSIVTLREMLIHKLMANHESCDDIKAVWKETEIDIDEKFDRHGWGLFDGNFMNVWTEKYRYEFNEYDGQLRMSAISLSVPALTGRGMHRYIDL